LYVILVFIFIQLLLVILSLRVSFAVMMLQRL